MSGFLIKGLILQATERSFVAPFGLVFGIDIGRCLFDHVQS